MPLYTFYCPSCNKITEQFAPVTELSNKCCECNNDTVRFFGKINVKINGGPIETTPVESQGKGYITGWADVADRNTGKKLGMINQGTLETT